MKKKNCQPRIFFCCSSTLWCKCPITTSDRGKSVTKLYDWRKYDYCLFYHRGTCIFVGCKSGIAFSLTWHFHYLNPNPTSTRAQIISILKGNPRKNDFPGDSTVGFGYIQWTDVSYTALWKGIDKRVRIFTPHNANPFFLSFFLSFFL